MNKECLVSASLTTNLTVSRARTLTSLRTLAFVTARNCNGESYYDAQGSRHGAPRRSATPGTRPTPPAITFHNLTLYTP
jgi:hypothetical protein